MTDLYTAACRHVAEWRNRGAPAAETAAIVDGLLADLQVVVSVADHDGEWRRDAEMRAMVAERDLASATALYGEANARAVAATSAARELGEAFADCPPLGRLGTGAETLGWLRRIRALLAKHAEVIR